MNCAAEVVELRTHLVFNCLLCEQPDPWERTFGFQCTKDLNLRQSLHRRFAAPDKWCNAQHELRTHGVLGLLPCATP